MEDGYELAEEHLNELNHVIYQHYGYDFSNYARPSFQRRVVRFIAMHSINNIHELIYKIRQQPSFFNTFLEEITVTVTEMYRDPTFYRTLKDEVFPVLSTYPLIRIWHAGCSTGEEVYSLSIFLEEAGLLQKSLVYATDINPAVIRHAIKGLFPLQHMQNYSQNYHAAGGKEEFSKYYSAKYNHALMDKRFSSRIIFSTHNLVSDASFNQFQLILCRNTLIYFDKELQDNVFRLFHESLENLGFLALGSKETIAYSGIAEKFTTFSKKSKIFRKLK